jgi:hypothetical protein
VVATDEVLDLPATKSEMPNGSESATSKEKISQATDSEAFNHIAPSYGPDIDLILLIGLFNIAI